jgi:hypothetical protein
MSNLLPFISTINCSSLIIRRVDTSKSYHIYDTSVTSDLTANNTGENNRPKPWFIIDIHRREAQKLQYSHDNPRYKIRQKRNRLRDSIAAKDTFSKNLNAITKPAIGK